MNDVADLAADYWDRLMRLDPVSATIFGDHRFDDQLPDLSKDARNARRRWLHRFDARLHRVDVSQLNTQDRITLDMMQQAVADELACIGFRLDGLNVDQIDGPQLLLMQLTSFQPVTTNEQFHALVTRYRLFAPYVDQYIDTLREGVRSGRTATRLAIDGVIAELRNFLAQPVEESALYTPAGQSADRRVELQKAIVSSVYPAFAKLLAYLESEYQARAHDGLDSVRGGAQIYRQLARHHTTTDLTPAEMHQIGMDELRQIHSEMVAVMESCGDHSGDIRGFAKRLVEDPNNHPTTRQELVDRSNSYLAAANRATSGFFRRLPVIPVEVRPVEEFREKEQPAAYYYQAPHDGGRPAIYYVNTYDLKSRLLHTLPALVFHESVPGHHLQLALSAENQGLPEFRRMGISCTAYVEGWALYAERLADEMGLYPDELARFGMLQFQAWRACRLVVDTGIHAMGWTRQQAIDFIMGNAGLSVLETSNEVDRYINWPGQALAYKVGQREIESLRRQATVALGDRFDLRSFHDELLHYGAIPLGTLRTVMEQWIEAQQTSSPDLAVA